MKKSGFKHIKIFNFLILFLDLNIFILQGYGQNSKNDYFIEGGIKGGYVIYDSYSALLKNTYSTGIDLTIGRQTYGKKECERWSKCPAYGVTARYTQYNNDLIGSKAAVFGFINGAFLRTPKFKFGYQIGLGLSYWFIHYDHISNPENIFIGSHINAHIDLGIDAYFTISKYSELCLKIDFSHSSNGAIVLPNKGVNSLNAAIGYRYTQGGHQEFQKGAVNRDIKLKNSLQFTFGQGIRQSKQNYTEISKSSNQFYYGFMLQALYLRQGTPFFAYGGGFDLLYSSELNLYLTRSKRGFKQGFSEAAVAAFELCYGNILIHGNVGFYLHRNVIRYSFYYERIGVRFLIGKQKNQFVGLSIKAHAFVADYIEWTYGYKFLKWADRKS